MKSKPISCGIIITNVDVILLGHSTGNKHWDIPKGTMDHGESVVETALRELKEETSLILTPDDIVDIGHHEYTPRKDLHLFLYRTDDLPSLNDISCVSRCERNGKWIPELDAFRYSPIKDIEKYVTKNMNRVLRNVFLTIK